MEQTGVKAFLKRKNVNITVQTYLIDALGAMAFGLFASLLIGTFIVIADYAKSATGAALGVAIAYALKAPQLVLFSAATVGIAGNALGGPVGALVATIVATELGKIVSKETRVDILVTPGVTIISGVLIAQFVGPGVAAFMDAFGIRAGGHRPDAAHLLRRHLRRPDIDGPCRRCRRGRMLRPDGRICRIKLSGKRRRRTAGPGTWHIYAPDGQHCKESKNLDSSDTGLYGYRPDCNRCFSDDQHPHCFRYGNLRTGRPYRRLHLYGRRRQYVAGNPSGLLCPSGCADLDFRRSMQKTWMD